MININGVIQNNRTASDFIRKQKKLNSVYKILNKAEEREMIGRYAKLLVSDGRFTFNSDFECDCEWIGSRDELIEKLIMHNLQAVTKISTKHCQDTRDYDNMYAKGLYGLTKAANSFHPFKLIVRKTKLKSSDTAPLAGGDSIFYSPDGKPSHVLRPHADADGKIDYIERFDIQYDADGNPTFVKFNTFAQFWIFKYVMDEFYTKSILVDNNSTSLDEILRIRNDQSKNITIENYLSNMIAPEVEPQKSTMDEIAATDTSSLYDSIHEYVKVSSDLSALERSIIENMFFDENMSVKKLSTMMKIPQQQILDSQLSALAKLKDFLYEEYGIESLSDVM